jgi:hypothetical protein
LYSNWPFLGWRFAERATGELLAERCDVDVGEDMKKRGKGRVAVGSDECPG